MSKLCKPVFHRPKHSCKTACNREPDELRELKYKLANINCKCGTCVSPNVNKRMRSVIKHSKSATDVQANRTNCLPDKFIQIAPKTASMEPDTETLHIARTHIRRPPCMNEHIRSGTGCQADQIDCSADTFFQASNNTAPVDSSRQTEFALTHLREPTRIGYTSGTGVQADQTECSVNRLIQASSKTASVDPSRQTLQMALTHLRKSMYINGYSSGIGVQADQTECSIDRFIQASSKTASVDPSRQTLQIALTHVRKPIYINGYTSGTGVQADQTEVSVDRLTQASSETVVTDPSTQTLQFTLIHVRQPSCANEYNSSIPLKADQIECSVDKFIQASQTASIDPKIHTLQSALTQLCKHNVLCPTCAVAFNFLRGEISKVYKDEESATARETNCDKSTTYDVTSVDRTTSMRLLVESPNLSLSDYFTSKLSSGTSIGHGSSRVRFRDEIDQKHYRMRQIYNLNFMSIDSFIDSIRPPL